MLFTIGLLLLLTPLPSFQATASVKRDSAGSEATKAAAVLTLSRPKPTAALIKETLRPTPKVNTVNQTVSSAPAVNQKPAVVNATVTTKRRLSPAAFQTTSSPAVKATASGGSITNKDKPTAAVNVTVTVTKSPSASDVKSSKDKPASSIAASGATNDKDKVTVSASQSAVIKAQPRTLKTIKDQLYPLINRTVSGKSHSNGEVRGTRDKPMPTGAKDVQSTPTNSASASGAKATKDKLQPFVNQTTSVILPSGSEARDTKHKPSPTVAPGVQSASASGAKGTKEKLNPSANQTASVKPPSGSDVRDTKHKSSPTAAPDVHATPTKSLSPSGVKTTKENHQPLVSRTTSEKSPSGSEARDTKHKPSPTVAPDVQSASASGTKSTKENLNPSANHTASVKSPSGSDVRVTKHKSAPTPAADVQSTPTNSASASGAKTTKEKHQPSANQTAAVKSPSGDEVTDNNDKPAPTSASEVHSTYTKNVSASGAKSTKEKIQPLVNQTVSVQSHPVNEGKSRKDKPAPVGTSEIPTTSRTSASASGAKTSKEKLQTLLNQTVSVKSASDEGTYPKDKPVLTAVQNVQSTSTNSAPASGSKSTKHKPTASVNQTAVVKSPSAGDVKNPDTAVSTTAKVMTASGSAADKDKLTASVNHTTVAKPPTTTKEKPALSQPIQVLISNGCDSSNAKEQELELQPGAPLVMTHKISLLPGGCTGSCEDQMAALIGRVARLEREMSLLKEKCPCSGNCPHECSGNGECEKGKCVCHQGFVGPDCSKCSQGAECTKKVVKGTPKETDETKAEQVNKNKQGKPTTAEETVKKEGKDAKPKVSTTIKKGLDKTQESHVQSSTDTSHHQHEKQKQEEIHKGTTNGPASKIDLQKTDGKSNELKDEPRVNVTGTGKIVTVLTKGAGTNQSRTQEEPERNVAQSPGHKPSRSDKESKAESGATGKEKATQGSQHTGNSTTTSASPQNKATTSKMRRDMRGSGLGSVKVGNVTSTSFTLTWLAPKGMFKNFTVIRAEPRLDGDEDDHKELEEEAPRGEKAPIAKNSTEVQVPAEITKTGATKGNVDTRRISIVVPGSVRSVGFSNLRANTRYDLKIYGSAAGKRSKVHAAAAITAPESATDIIFSNVTESSLTVSWSKPQSTFTGFRVSYTNSATGQRHFVTVAPGQSHVVLSKLSAGSSYVISVTTTRGRAQSDALTSVITTVPAPPTRLQVVNVTDTRAVLQWTPSPGKVDRFIIAYESSKTPNVTVTVMLTGNSAEHQLRGLQRGTVYTVKVLSQKGSLQSSAVSAAFTTAGAVKAREVGPRSAVIGWKTPAVAFQRYRVIYQVAGEKKNEVILEPTITEHKLTGLLPMSRYLVVVQGEREGQYTSLVTSEFITGKLRFPFPAECSQELLNGAVQSGEVEVYPQGKEGQAVRVYCDMETDGGGWTVFQRRMNGKMDFYRNWTDYKAGFGNLSEEFWLGNEALHSLTSAGPVSLRVDMRSGNDTAHAHYSNFSVDSEKRHYALTAFGFTGSAGDSLRYHNGRPFSTWDKDPHSLGIHCAKAYTGGWWYKNCYKTNLNGRYGANSDNQGIVWIDWKGKDFSIPFIEMKIRPSTFSPATRG